MVGATILGVKFPELIVNVPLVAMSARAVHVECSMSKGRHRPLGCVTGALRWKHSLCAGRSHIVTM